MNAPQKKTNDAKIRAITRQIRGGYSAEHGFLHIPKTGGSGVSTYGKELVGRGYPFPVVFPHGWTLREIREHFPKMKISFILRDPLGRMISGFQSRLRQGRPTYNIVWTPAEAAAFAIFPSVRHWLDAMLSEDEFHISAVNFAMRSVRHLHWNYAFYFEGVEAVRAERVCFHRIGTMETVAGFIEDLTELSAAPRSLAAELYEKRHESGTRTGDVLQQYSPEEITRIRGFLRKEHRIHEELASLAG